jgi:signal transduction histidine kinase/CheY-like chemotaxis protein
MGTGRPETRRFAAFRKAPGGLGSHLILVALTGLSALSVVGWRGLALWAALVLAVGVLEVRIPLPSLCGAALTILASILYATASLALIVWGGPAARLFSFALLAVSMVHVLMRHYQSPVVFLLGISPHMAVLVAVGLGLAKRAAAHGDWLGAATPAATVALFAALFWAARAQLAASWSALATAKSQAQERERAAEAANRAKSQFLATMSHEIRTPLNGVLGMAWAMPADELSPVQRERLKTIRRSGETLLAVVNDVLDLSKIEASKLDLEIVEFDMDHLARGVVAAFTPLANRKGVSFGFEVEAPALGVYRGDSIRLRQVLYNLVSNAVKFTEAGHVNLRIAREDDVLLFEVADTGIGIEAENLPRLFDDFFQADAAMTRRYGGSGLGLAICRELIQLMDGRIEVASRRGEGSTFRLWLPLPRVADTLHPKTGTAAAAQARAEPQDIRVLAAEDNEVNQLVLKTLLLQAGVDPTIVSNGAEAVAAWEREDWDVILMDVQMPELDGPGATRAIRAREAETGRRRTPVIALTANAMAHQRAEYEAAGMDDLVPKPIDITRLFEALDQALSGPEPQALPEAVVQAV